MIELDKSNDGLWTVTLNRPDKANSLTHAMLTELADIAEAATEARALVLTGRGKAFSAGMDLEAAQSGLPTDPVWERLSGALTALPCLTIAALNGTVAGGAMGMVLACDLRLAVPGTKAFYPVMKLGFLPQPSDPERLARLIGPSRARMILMAGQKIDTDTALHWGLFDRLAEPDALLSTARDLATDALAATPDHAARIKHLCRP
ncbi:enoyl-CoA hydratase/isomerase family protein [Roseovarius atlanticus]|uniref:enoyl-CoA hydratase/isomerase family protein n=1 Tax=Roseovarius atlanticus TaxID=1641875 RepID=UPI001C97FCAC|nr:enoyl-CoA hydratase/isomerase family protein [Roseovarius atlanticus]MBY5990111.1 enoyl-CoA hydratase/isomerase family protein [Roseovarius atlanticus]MBY6126657.1 enoyl-CoA hydratase/isomerase family protein [Roseovarius atlanticus]MBY6151151.1 enoyl-CoA hydratase/isomerase family protein [Roseovarius atlanticus]